MEKVNSTIAEIKNIIANVNQDDFLQFLKSPEGKGQQDNYLFFNDFISSHIKQDLFDKAVEEDINSYLTIGDLIDYQTEVYYKKPSWKEINYYKLFWSNQEGQRKQEILFDNDNIILTTDRFNKIFFDTEALRNKKGFEGKLPTEVIIGEDKDILYVSMDFEKLNLLDIKLTGELTPYDERVCIAVASNYYSGVNPMSLTQIFNYMGFKNTNKPNTTQLTNIKNSLIKLNVIKVELDTSMLKVIDSNGEKVERMKDSCINYVEVTSSTNGIKTDKIYLYADPIMIRFSRLLGQYTTISKKTFCPELTKTNTNIKAENYIIKHICYLKNKKEKRQKVNYNLTFAKICEVCNIPLDRDHRQQRSRLLKEVNLILSYQKDCSNIKNYVINADKRITFYL